MTNPPSVLKAHYDIIYKNVVRKSDNSQMDLNSFFDAIEELAIKLLQNKRNQKEKRGVLESLQEIIDNLVD